MINLKKVGAEIILGTIVLPWVIWVTLAIFDSKTAQAVQETRYDYIAKRLDEIRLDVKAMRK